jgi:transcriptional regulator with XRE-family HTH domain
MEQENFTVLENKVIGKNISMYRKLRGMKASDVAERLSMKESSYTRYERGEGAITVDLIQQVAEVFNVDPLMLLSVSPSNFIENSPNSAIGNYSNNWHAGNEEHTKIMLKLMESIVTLNEKLISLLDKEKK